MAPHALSVIAKIKPGRENQLRGVLARIAADPENNPYLRFHEGRLTHLANFVIFDDEDNGPRLFFSSNHDGPLREYVEELKRVGPGLDEVWGQCEGFLGLDDLYRFVSRHSHKSQAYFIGFREETVVSTLGKIALREKIEEFLRLPAVAAYLDRPGIGPFLDALSRLAGRPAGGAAAARPTGVRGGPLRRLFFRFVLRFAKFYGALIVDKNFNSAAANYGQGDVHDVADRDFMTNLIDIKPGRSLWLRVVLFYLDFLGRYAFQPGHLAGVVTIHFARWAIVDNGKRLLFQSKFDGSWENYMGDFVDKVDWGLDACWTNTVGYPTAGMHDIDSFKRFIRDRQFEHLYVYNAYPCETVLNIIRDRRIADTLTVAYDRPAVESWLARL
jgi:hypothetical protein